MSSLEDRKGHPGRKPPLTPAEHRAELRHEVNNLLFGGFWGFATSKAGARMRQGAITFFMIVATIAAIGGLNRYG